MKINRSTEYIDHVIRKGDKVRVKTVEQLKDEYAATVDERNVYVYFNTVREDDDGMMQEYKVRSYKDLKYKGELFEMPDVGRVHSSGIYPFDVKIESFGREQTLRLFYNSYEHTWKLIRRA